LFIYFKEYLQQAQDLVENESILLQTLGKGHVLKLMCAVCATFSTMATAEEMLVRSKFICWQRGLVHVINVSVLAL